MAYTNFTPAAYGQFIASAVTGNVALPGGGAVPVCVRGRAGALLQPAAGLPGGADCRVHDGGCETGVSDGEELLAELHDQLRAPGELYRPLAEPADADDFAGRGWAWGA